MHFAFLSLSMCSFLFLWLLLKLYKNKKDLFEIRIGLYRNMLDWSENMNILLYLCMNTLGFENKNKIELSLIHI